MMIDIDKFVASIMKCLCMPHREEAYMCRHWINKALDAQGLKFENGEIVKSQRTIAAEAKEAIFDNEDERIRKMCITYLGRLYHYCSFADDIKNIEKCIAWLEKQGELPEGCVRKQVAEAKEALYTAEVETGDGGIKAVVTKEVSIKSEDERIREALLYVLKSDFEKETTICDITVGDIIAWLEKQGEQKPAWSAEDEEKFAKVYYATLKFFGGDTSLADWIKSLKERLKGK